MDSVLYYLRLELDMAFTACERRHQPIRIPKNKLLPLRGLKISSITKLTLHSLFLFKSQKMKKVFLLITITATSFVSYAQQGMGVGNTNPQEMLDVSGAIKIGTDITNTLGAPIGGEGTVRFRAGIFEGWDGTAWVALGGGGTSSAFETISNVTSNNPGATATDDFVFGAVQLNNVTGSGDDSRLFFDKSKSAFRAGYVSGTQWDDANVGSYSTAMGQSTTASGEASTAMGSNTTASGDGSTAMGQSTTASGTLSTAMGALTQALGSISTAMGNGTKAEGVYSTAMGSGTLASGFGSTAIGNSTTASGNLSTALGASTTAPSLAETSVGRYNTSYVLGNNGATAWNAADRLFVVGNGTSSSSLSNALIITKDGTMNINDAYDMPTADGTADFVMSTDGNGVVSFVDPNTLISDDGDWIVNGTDISNANTGNVGIGSSIPSAKLCVRDEAGASPFVARFTKNSNTVGELTGVGFGAKQGANYVKSAILHETESTNGVGKLHFAVDNATDVNNVTLAESRMTIDRNGNTGIGTTSPGVLLDVLGLDPAPSGTDHILARFKVETTARGAGIQIEGTRNSTGNVTSFVDLMNNNNIVGRLAAERGAGNEGSLLFYTNSGSTLTERMRINTAGTVQLNTYTTNGIVRTTSGNGTLSTVGGGVNLASEVTGVLQIANGGTGSATQNFVDLTTAQTAAGVKTWSNNAFFNGKVSIGTTSTSYKLDVDGNGHFNGGLKIDGIIGTDVCSGGCSFAAYTQCCPVGGQTGFRNMGLYVSEGVRAREFYTESDERIKDVIGISNAKNDLDKIMAIEITDYTFVDKTKGHSTMKKVIAQQVEKIFPEAVAKSISIVPDIYQLTSIIDGFIPLKTNVENGDNVRLIYDDNAVVLAEVTSVVEDGFYVNQDRTGQVFVYGREVNDFRTVDYDAISMLNVSATQELFKLITELQRSNSELKSELKNYASLQSDLEKIKGVLGLDLQTSQ
jgi:hypothetical protein